MKSKILVFLQFFTILLMIFPFGKEVSYPFLGTAFIVFGMGIGLLAIKTHQQGNFNIRPDIKENCELVTHGIYAYIRHPMYLSVLVMMFGFLILYSDLYRFILYIFLVIVLHVKLHYEESLWVCHSKEYEAYKQRTKKLIPFIY
ncbi:MAG: isoprenylcysteine carboxylmethyltransferase family protein [Epsilonproteobacteria bacterium]|nr:isoprenylcysteine carboxylmethyltransferase family protein [Campylobacterota bacterium]